MNHLVLTPERLNEINRLMLDMQCASVDVRNALQQKPSFDENGVTAASKAMAEYDAALTALWAFGLGTSIATYNKVNGSHFAHGGGK